MPLMPPLPRAVGRLSPRAAIGRRACLALALALTASACSSDDDAKTPLAPTAERGLELPDASRYSAEIRWTDHGVPHVVGDTIGDAIFGQAFANATLNICTFSDIVLMANSKRAAHLGPGKDGKWIETDFAHLALGVRARAEASWTQLSEDGRAALIAYAAGTNHYIDTTPPGELPKRCRDAKWVKPITPVDLLTWYLTIALQAGNRNFAQYIGTTRPPDTEWSAATPRRAPRQVAGRSADTQARWLGRYADLAVGLAQGRVFGMPADEAIGSNGWAVGGDLSDNGKGMVLGNPHFPWFGELRFYENHLTVKNDPTHGAMDVYGGTLIGVPGVQIGFTQGFGWTHTVSFSSKFTFYKLKLKEGDPLTYIVDGDERKITGTESTIDVLQPDGTVTQKTRTYYRSEVGVMAALPAVAEWTKSQAFTIRDANEANLALIDHFLAIDRAQSVADAQKVLHEVQGLPWVNLMGADSAGDALFSDACSEPNLSQAAQDLHTKKIDDGDFLTEFAYQLGAVLLDGSLKINDWVDDADPARQPGLVACKNVPALKRRDYVANANESHWLTNASAPLEGYSTVFGLERTVRSLRTRVGLHLLTSEGKDSARGADGKFNLDELQSVVDAGHTMGATLLHQGVVDLCAQVTSVTLLVDKQDQTVDVTPACAVLKAWDGGFTASSKGAVLFREWFAGYDNRDSSGELWATPFDVKSPVATPHTLKLDDADPAATRAMRYLALAVLRLQEQKIPLDAPLGDQQFTLKDGKRMPVPGAFHGEGAFNVIGWSAGRDSTTFGHFARDKVVHSASGLTTSGYAVNYGSSFVMALQFTDKGPVARTLVTYSQSAEPDSPWHSDQTAMFAKQQWKTARFSEADVLADPKLQVQKLPRK